jgi:hypothetical protein
MPQETPPDRYELRKGCLPFLFGSGQPRHTTSLFVFALLSRFVWPDAIRAGS